MIPGFYIKIGGRQARDNSSLSEIYSNSLYSIASVNTVMIQVTFSKMMFNVLQMNFSSNLMPVSNIYLNTSKTELLYCQASCS